MTIASALLSYSIIPRATAPLIYAIVSSNPACPRNVLSHNVGDGSMDVQWDEPVSGVVHHYDVLIATASGGPFKKANKYPITGKNHAVRNIPFGYTVYTKVRAVDSGGNEGPLSDLADDAIASAPTMQIRFVAPIGDVFVADSFFSCILNDTIVAARLGSGGTITG